MNDIYNEYKKQVSFRSRNDTKFVWSLTCIVWNIYPTVENTWNIYKHSDRAMRVFLDIKNAFDCVNHKKYKTNCIPVEFVVHYMV